jgi:hypothetical protein
MATMNKIDVGFLSSAPVKLTRLINPYLYCLLKPAA